MLTLKENITFNVINDNGIISFYDARFIEGFTEYGQFISSYFVSTFFERGYSGLCLDGGIPDWTVSADGIEKVKQWVLGK